MDVEALKERERRVWGGGDYTTLSELLRPAAQVLCDACAVSAGQEVLDVAAGDGNFALASAREGASVVASDIAPGMVERGSARSQAEGYDVEWVEADAEALPFEDERFDCAGSVFGAMIAPRPEQAASELFRVVRPGNTVGLTAWTPGSFMAELFGLARAMDPSRPRGPHAEDWGDEEIARERVAGLAGQVEFERHVLVWEAERPEDFAARVGETAPPWAAARQAMEPQEYESMRAGLVDLIRRRGGEGPVRVESEYAVLVARRPG